ncbi:MAG: hypothetical protein NXI31_21220 [bacterium]|nr:hypothetical protein [bacterium]
MKHQITFAAAAVALAAGASAQVPLGTFTNVGTTFTTRGFSAASEQNPATLFTRHDKEAYAGWTDGAVANSREVTGLNFVIQDEDLSTQESFQIVVWSGDDATQVDFPDVNSGMVGATLIGLPIQTGGGAFNASFNFATPVSLPADEDVYTGLQLNSAWTITGTPPTITDGLSVWECHAEAPTTPQAGQAWDVPGAGVPTTSPSDTFSGYYVPNPATGPAYPVKTQFKIQPIVAISGGVAGAVTNQTNHVASTAGSTAGFTVQLPGAGSAVMHSGQFPDAANPPLNAGRADDLTQMFHNDSIDPNSLVFFLIDIGSFNPLEIQAASFVPGSTGVSCLNFGSQQTLGFAPLMTVGTSQRAFRITTFPAAARPLLSGINWLQQAVAVDVATNTIHATACTRQRT